MIKRKRLNDVYMKEVKKSIIKTKFSEELNAYITYKHSVDTTFTCKVYVNGKRKVIFDKGYTLLEYSPLDEKYNVRAFIDDKGNILQYYFDVIKDFEIEDGEIYYNDLYLDVLYHLPFFSSASYIELADENELIDSYNKKEIDKETFDYCYKVAEKIMNELSKGKNRFVNRGIKDYLEMKNSRFNKEELEQIIKNLDIPKEEYYILSSGNLVLRGLFKDAGDLDICISQKGFDLLSKKYNLVKKERGFYQVNENVECVVEDISKRKYDDFGKYNLQSLEEYYDYLKESKREKDKIRLEIVEKELK